MRRRFLSAVAASLAAPPLIACAPDLDALVGPPGKGAAGLPPPLIWDGLLARHRRVDAGGVAGFAYGAVSAVEQDDLADYLRAPGRPFYGCGARASAFRRLSRRRRPSRP